MESKYTLENLQEWVRFLYGSGAIKQDSDIADAMGVHKSSVSNAINGRVSLSQRFVTKFIQAFPQVLKHSIETGAPKEGGGVGVNEPETKYDKTITGKKKYDDARVVNLADVTIMQIPLVSQYAYSGYAAGFQDESFMEALPTIPMLADREHKGNYLAFETKGVSMFDGSHESFKEGNIVIGREIPQHYWLNKLHFKAWRYFIIVTKNDGVLLKEIVGHDVEKGVLRAHNLNPEYEDFDIHLKDVAQIFNVVEKREKF